MSGGHYRYPHGWDLQDITENLSDLEDLANDLASRGYKDAARETHELRLTMLQVEVLAMTIATRLYPVWKALDYEISGDWGPDQVAEAVAKYRGGK